MKTIHNTIASGPLDKWRHKGKHVPKSVIPNPITNIPIQVLHQPPHHPS